MFKKVISLIIVVCCIMAIPTAGFANVPKSDIDNAAESTSSENGNKDANIESNQSEDNNACVELTKENWNQYFEIQEIITDTSLVLNGAGEYSIGLDYYLRLKDSYVDYIDVSHITTVNISFSYKECHDMFNVSLNDLTYSDEGNYATIKECTTKATIEFPECLSDEKPWLIVSESMLGGPKKDRMIGVIAKEFTVSEIYGILYFTDIYTEESSTDNTDQDELSQTKIYECESWKDITQILLYDNFIVGLKSDGTVLTAGETPEWLDVSSWKGIKQIVNGRDTFVAGLKNDGTVAIVSGETSDLYDLDIVKTWSNISKLSAGYFEGPILCGFYNGSDSYVETYSVYYFSPGMFGDSLKDIYYEPFQVSVIDKNDVALFNNDGRFVGMCTDVAALGDDAVLHKDGTVENLYGNYSDGSENWKNIKKIYTCKMTDSWLTSIAAVDSNNKLFLNRIAEKVFGEVNITDAKSAVITCDWLAVLHTNGTVSIYKGDESADFEDILLEDRNFDEKLYEEGKDYFGKRYRAYSSDGKEILEFIDLKYDGTYVKGYFNVTEKTVYSKEYEQYENPKIMTLESYEEGTFSYEKGNSDHDGTFTLYCNGQETAYKDEDYYIL